MPLSDLVTGGPACGPSNPLQSLGKRFGQDRSTQMDRFDGEGDANMMPTFRGHQHHTRGQSDNPAFFQNGGPSFDMQPLQGALPLAQSSRSSAYTHHSPQVDLNGAWQHHPAQQNQSIPAAQREHFERGFRHCTPPTTNADSRWAREYSPSAMNANPTSSQSSLQHQPQHVHQNQLHRPMSYGPMPMSYQGYGAGQMGIMNRPGFAPQEVHRPMSTMQNVQQTGQSLASDTDQWNTAFSAIEQHQEPVPSAQISEIPEQNAEQAQRPIDPNEADELAKTAGRLVSTVEHETNDKFKQSKFLNLMRKVRDRQAGIQGTDIVETPVDQQNAAQAPVLDKGKGRAFDPSASTTQKPNNQMEAMNQRSQMNALNSTRVLAHGPDALKEELEGRQMMNDLWAEEEAQKEAEEQLRMNRMAFVGDGGDEVQRRAEDDAEFMKYQGLLGAHLGPAAAGLKQDSKSSNGMEEDIDELENADFVGRQWQGNKGRGVPGMQAAEWDALQKDWDTWQATSAGLEQSREAPVSAASAPQYQFHAYNPYIGATSNPAREATTAALPADMQSVLEREAAVQQDPNNASAWLDLGVKQQENEREGLAIAALQRAIQIDPTIREAWLALAVSYTNESDRNAALEAVERWVDATPEYRAIVREYRKQFDESQNPINKASQTQIERHEALIKLLIALARHSSTQNNIDADIQVALGVLFNASEDYDKAVDCFTAALQVRPDDWLMYNRLGATLSNSGRSAEALRYYQQALDLKPGFVRCHFNMSISCLNLQMYREAASHIYTALCLQSESVDLSGDAMMQETTATARNSSVTSSSLFETLRVCCELLDRPDLADLAAKHDLDAFDPSEFWGSEGEGNNVAMEPTM
ncbi:hypothetical protein L7F22_052810 [Adiantum nelumboides]|nr:hypothetical protein [Adiantum nelumboides]